GRVPGHVEAGQQHQRVPQHEARAPDQGLPAPPRQQRRRCAMRQHAEHRHQRDGEKLGMARPDEEVVGEGEQRRPQQRPAEGQPEDPPPQQVKAEKAQRPQRDIGELPGQEGIGPESPKRGQQQPEAQIPVIIAQRRGHRVEVEGPVPGDRLAGQPIRPMLHDGEGDHAI
ncbi:MAG: hypothetical protein ACK56I_18840, partial [bacterium]